MLRMLRGDAPAAEVAALESLSGHGQRPWPQRLDLRRAGGRLDPRGPDLGVLAGIGALKGPLHGGAPGPVIDMLDAIGAPDNARGLDRGDAGQPRRPADGLRPPHLPRARSARRRAEGGGAPAGSDGLPTAGWRFAEAVERAALDVLRERKPDRALQTNVEFYTALLLEALGFPPAAFTCVFAPGRVAGWIAHAREQAASGRLIRPRSRYVGPRPDLAA